MKNKRMLAIRIATILLVIALCVVLYVVGRGHTVYFDNKTLEYNGKTYEAPYKVEVAVKGAAKAPKLYAKERGQATWMGQSLKLTLTVTEKKNGDSYTKDYTVKLPLNQDGVIVNLPGLIAGLPGDAILSEFVSAVPVEPEEPEVPGPDDSGLIPSDPTVLVP